MTASPVPDHRHLVAHLARRRRHLCHLRPPPPPTTSASSACHLRPPVSRHLRSWPRCVLITARASTSHLATSPPPACDLPPLSRHVRPATSATSGIPSPLPPPVSRHLWSPVCRVFNHRACYGHPPLRPATTAHRPPASCHLSHHRYPVTSGPLHAACSITERAMLTCYLVPALAGPTVATSGRGLRPPRCIHPPYTPRTSSNLSPFSPEDEGPRIHLQSRKPDLWIDCWRLSESRWEVFDRSRGTWVSTQGTQTSFYFLELPFTLDVRSSVAHARQTCHMLCAYSRYVA